MRGEKNLTKPQQFEIVFKKGASWADRLVVLKALPNGLDFSRYGLSVSQRVGGAVIRNRVKRLFREILRATPLKPGWDIVLIARQPTAKISYNELKTSVDKLLGQAGIIERIPEE